MQHFIQHFEITPPWWMGMDLGSVPKAKLIYIDDATLCEYGYISWLPSIECICPGYIFALCFGSVCLSWPMWEALCLLHVAKPRSSVNSKDIQPHPTDLTAYFLGAIWDVCMFTQAHDLGIGYEVIGTNMEGGNVLGNLWSSICASFIYTSCIYTSSALYQHPHRSIKGQILIYNCFFCIHVFRGSKFWVFKIALQYWKKDQKYFTFRKRHYNFFTIKTQ